MGHAGWLVVHLMAMHLASAGPLLCVWLQFRARRSQLAAEERSMLRQHAQQLAVSCLAALLVGVATGLLLWWWGPSGSDRDYAATIQRFYDRVWWGGWELLFYLLIMGLYAATCRRGSSQSAWQWLLYALGITAAANQLYHFPPLFTLMASHARAADLPAAPLTSAEYRQLLLQPLVIAKSVHFGLAAIAVAGAWLLLFSRRSSAVSTAETIRIGATSAVAATALQLPSGILLVALLPPWEQQALMGQDVVATGLLFSSLILALAALNQTAAVAVGEVTGARPRMAGAMVMAVVATMILITCRLG